MNKIIIVILVIILSLVLAFSCYMIFSEVSQSEKEKNDFENLSEIITKPIETEVADEEKTEEEAIHKRNLAPLFEQNPDCIGWIYIEGTAVDYPVVHTPYEPQKYLRMNFEGEYAMSGVPFLEGTRELTDDNIVIYGHNMKNGTMFSDLSNYVYKDYFKMHPVIEFETAGGVKYYDIFAVVIFKETDAWYYFDSAFDEEHFNEMIYDIKCRAVYETGVAPEYGKQIITLSTCYGSKNEDRLVVIGTEQ